MMKWNESYACAFHRVVVGNYKKAWKGTSLDIGLFRDLGPLSSVHVANLYAFLGLGLGLGLATNFR